MIGSAFSAMRVWRSTGAPVIRVWVRVVVTTEIVTNYLLRAYAVRFAAPLFEQFRARGSASEASPADQYAVFGGVLSVAVGA